MTWLIAAARRWWRGLTSMRTALILLFLLAVAAIPGSLLPQRNVSIAKVSAYLAQHPKSGPVYDRLALFDVFASPWFSAIYLLLFVSLVGCLGPRLRAHGLALLRPPGIVPARLDRLPVSATVSADLDAAEKALRAKHFRTTRRGDAISAEKGYLKETGNLVFHFALMVLLLGVAFGSWWGWHGNRLVIAGADTGFCDSLQQYDEYGLGARIQGADLPKFCVTVNDFAATYTDSGQPLSYRADVTYTQGLGSSSAATGHKTLAVNDPLRLDGANVYLLGHGYAAVLKYTDRFGQSQTSVVPFLPSDTNLTSSGVAVFPDANVDPKTGKRDTSLQVAFAGQYLPTVAVDVHTATSVYPAERNPALFLTFYQGNVGRDAGIPSSVYELDPHQLATGALKAVGDPIRLLPGGSQTLADGTTIEFLGTRPWVTVSVRSDPGEKIVLVSAVCLLLGLLLSLTGKRRRVYARRQPDGTLLLGGLPRSDYPGFSKEFDEVVSAIGGSDPTEKAKEPEHVSAV